MHQTLLPEGWPRPSGYANGICASGNETLYIAGQIGWLPNGEFASDNLAEQFKQCLLNIKAVLACADAGPEHITRMTWFITDKQAYLAQLREIGQAYREVIGKHYPAMSVVEVSALIEDRALVEIEATAVK